MILEIEVDFFKWWTKIRIQTNEKLEMGMKHFDANNCLKKLKVLKVNLKPHL